MSKSCKIWLWFLFIVNAASLALSLITWFLHAGTATVLEPSIFWAQTAASAAFVLGIVMLLFLKKRVGFYLMCTIALIIYIVRVFVFHQNIFICIGYAVASPLITWLFLKYTHAWETLK